LFTPNKKNFLPQKTTSPTGPKQTEKEELKRGWMVSKFRARKKKVPKTIRGERRCRGIMLPSCPIEDPYENLGGVAKRKEYRGRVISCFGGEKEWRGH